MKNALRVLIGVVLVATFLAPAVHAYPTNNSPAPDLRFTNVTPAEVDTFLARWNPVFKEQAGKEWGFMLAMDQMLKAETNATQLVTRLLGALDREPQGLWVSCLKMLSQPAADGSTLPPVQMLAAWKQACVTLEQAAQKTPQDELIRDALELARQSFVVACLEAGRNLDEAQVVARQMLAHTRSNTWNYGNVVYDAHSALGRIALRQGDRATARQELRAAGQTPGSPQLNSFGPQFTLARELLEQAEPADREAVVAFLGDVARFCANPDQAPAYRKADLLKAKAKFETWQEEIRAGKLPGQTDPMDKFRWR